MKIFVNVFLRMLVTVAIWVPFIILFVNLSETLEFININLGWQYGSVRGIHLLVSSPLICAIILFVLTIKLRKIIAHKTAEKKYKLYESEAVECSSLAREYAEKKEYYQIVIQTCTVWRNIGFICLALLTYLLIETLSSFIIETFLAEIIFMIAAITAVTVIPIKLKKKIVNNDI